MEGSCAGLQRLVAELAVLPQTEDKLAAIERAFMDTLGIPMAVFTPLRDGVLLRHHSAGFIPDEVDNGRAASVIVSRAQTSRLRNDRRETIFVPLLTANACVGVLAFTTRDADHLDWPLIGAFVGQTALALERSRLEEAARSAKTLCEIDRFEKTLLDSVAHNVRTPLATIIGVLSTLQEDAAMLDAPVRRELVDTARQEAERLNRLLGNLLDLSRLQSGSVRVRSDRCDVQDVIGAALEQLGPALRDREIRVVLDPNLPAVPMDFVLIVQVIVNLLDNALKYSPQNAPVCVEARQKSAAVTITVSDDGDGVPCEKPERVFRKFDRAGRSGEVAGIGLGLPICKCFVEAHGGAMWIERRKPRGTKVAFALPLKAHVSETRAA